MTRSVRLLLAIVSLEACTRGSAQTSPDAGSERSATADAVSATINRAVSEFGGGGPTSWRGSYKSRAGTLYVPPDWKTVHWTVAESASGLGEGAIRLIFDPSTGRVGGVVGGPLGPALVTGFLSEGSLTASVARENPDDRGFAGTLVATVNADRVDGTMHVSPSDAESVRIGTFALDPDGSRGNSR